MLKVDPFYWARCLIPFNPTVPRALAPCAPGGRLRQARQPFCRCCLGYPIFSSRDDRQKIVCSIRILSTSPQTPISYVKLHMYRSLHLRRPFLRQPATLPFTEYLSNCSVIIVFWVLGERDFSLYRGLLQSPVHLTHTSTVPLSLLRYHLGS